MSEWRENSRGNHVFILDNNEVMTVYQRDLRWFGVYDSRFTEDGFDNPEKAMALMEKAVLNGELNLLVKRQPTKVGWHKTKTGGYHCIRRDRTLTVKQARTGKWYLVVDQNLVEGRWFTTAEEAMRQGDQL